MARSAKATWRAVMRSAGLCACLVLAFSLAAPVLAQSKATLIADSMAITPGDVLVATGDVEVIHEGYRLMARRIVYDRTQNKLVIDGPISLDDGQSVTILASSAELSDDLRDGLIRSARMIIDQQLQITAGTMQRVDGRYSAMFTAAASSCKTCLGRAPLWEIRASRVVHDTVEKQLYFDNAQFRLAGVPLAYFPRLRLADPTLERATGFLVPKLEVSTSLGFGVKLPYFIALGPSKDLLITPFATDLGDRSVALRYRQAFSTGNITVDGAVSSDTTENGKLRGYVLASGNFRLPADYTLRLRGETVSDAGFFNQYGLTEQDRFVTSAEISRANRERVEQARVLGFYSVRSRDNNATQPSQIADYERLQRLDMGDFGDLSFGISAKLRQRASSDPLDGPDPDGAADGRDVGGFGLSGEWQKSALLPYGVLGQATLGVRLDRYRVDQDAVYAGDYNRNTAAFAAELRWPLIKSSADGGTHTLEPMAQVVLAPENALRLFNEDSALVEFDEGNLFALNRFPGSDRIEASNRANLGLNYTYAAPNGQRLQLSLGRVISANTVQQFADASGLGQARSDWLVAGQLDMNSSLGLTARSLFTEDGDVRKLELRSAVKANKTALSLGYLYTRADTDEQRADTISEISLFASQTLSQRWNASVTARYDAQAEALSKSGAELVYRNECLKVDVSLSRSFATSSSVDPNTVFGLSVAFLGFGGQAAGVAEQCRG